MLKGIKKIFDDETELLETQELEELENDLIDDSFKVDTAVNTSAFKGKSVVKIFNPVTKSASSTIIDAIKKGELCIVNFSKLSGEEANIVFSTLSGSIYSLDGVYKMVDEQIMLCAPKNFLIDGDLPE